MPPLTNYSVQRLLHTHTYIRTTASKQAYLPLLSRHLNSRPAYSVGKEMPSSHPLLSSPRSPSFFLTQMLYPYLIPSHPIPAIMSVICDLCCSLLSVLLYCTYCTYCTIYLPVSSSVSYYIVQYSSAVEVSGVSQYSCSPITPTIVYLFIPRGEYTS